MPTMTSIPIDLILLIVVVLIEVVAWYLRVHYNATEASVEERELYTQANKVKDEAEKFLSPDTFLKHAKLSREANAMETRALQLERERKIKADTALGRFTSKFVSKRLPIMLALVWVLDFPGPAMIIPYDGWFWPAGRILTMGGGDSLPPSSVSYLGWTLLVHRVSSRLLMKCFG